MTQMKQEQEIMGMVTDIQRFPYTMGRASGPQCF